MDSLPTFHLTDVDWDSPPCPVSSVAAHDTTTREETDTRHRHSRLHVVFWRAQHECVVLKEVALSPEEMPRETASARLARVSRLMQAPLSVPLLRYRAVQIDDDRHYAWLMTWCRGGSLRQWLRHTYKPQTLDSPLSDCAGEEASGAAEAFSRKVARQLLTALCFLHDDAHVLHGDVNAANVLITSPLTSYDEGTTPKSTHSTEAVAVQLADLDDACDLGTVLTQPTGALLYRAPEWWRPPSDGCCDSPDDNGASTEPVWRTSPAVDIWSFGVLLAQLLTGKVHPCLPKVNMFSPEAEGSVWALMDVLGVSDTNASVDVTALHVSCAARDVLAGCLAWNPTARLSAAELLGMPWFHGA